MPLDPGAEGLIILQLERIERQEKVGVISVGWLTETQHRQINECRAERKLPPLDSPEMVYLGKHHHQSRSKDGYARRDLFLQVESGVAFDAEVALEKHMTAVVSAHLRPDGYGNLVRDRVILELSARKPRAEIYSAIPKGDRIKPQ